MSNNKRVGVGISFEESLAVQSVPFYSFKKIFFKKKDLYYYFADHQDEFYDFSLSPEQLMHSQTCIV